MKVKLPKLNLPSFEYKVKHENEGLKIYDSLRKKYLVLTPEEWVRQHYIHFLKINDYPVGLLKQEYPFNYNGMDFRADIVVFSTSYKPVLLVECKAPNVELNEKEFDQVMKYNRVINAPLLVLTNGKNHIVSYIKDAKNYFIKDLPKYEEVSN